MSEDKGVHISPKEVYDSVQSISYDVKLLVVDVKHIQTTLEDYNKHKELATEAHRAVTEMKEHNKWKNRFIITAIVTSIIAPWVSNAINQKTYHDPMADRIIERKEVYNIK